MRLMVGEEEKQCETGQPESFIAIVWNPPGLCIFLRLDAMVTGKRTVLLLSPCSIF